MLDIQAVLESRYPDLARRAASLAHALTDLGIQSGDRIATLAWNDQRHYELYFAISGIGAVCHTINPRLFPDQISYIIRHAQDRWIFVDPTLMPVLEGVAEQIAGVPAGVVVGLLLGLQGVVGEALAQARHDQALAGQIGGGDQVASGALGGDLPRAQAPEGLDWDLVDVRWDEAVLHEREE